MRTADNVAEMAVIGSMLIDEECVGFVVERLGVADFENKFAREAFEIVCDLNAEGKPPTDLYMVSGRAKDQDAMYEWLKSVFDITPTAANVEEYVKAVKQNAIARHVGDIGYNLSLAGTDYQDVVADSIERLGRILERGHDADVLKAGEWADSFLKTETQIINDPQSAYCSTGLSDLDRILGGGMFNSGLYVLAARPGMGKTTVALNIAELVAKRGEPILYVSLEMSDRQVMCKRISAESLSLEYRKLMSGDMTWDEQIDMEESLRQIKDRPFNINKRFGVTVNDISSMAKKIDGCKLVVIDYFGLISVDGDGRGRYEDYTAISGKLKQLSCQLNIPILCLAQLNRETEKRNNKKPVLSDLRDTGAIEQDADGVIFLHRDGYYAEDNRPEEEWLNVIVAKNRHGETGTLQIWWQGKYGRIAQAERYRTDEMEVL